MLQGAANAHDGWRRFIRHRLAPLGLVLSAAAVIYMCRVSAIDFLGNLFPVPPNFSMPTLDTSRFEGYRVVPVALDYEDAIEGQALNFSSIYRTFNDRL